MPETFALVHLLNGLFMGVEVKAFQSIGLSAVKAAEMSTKVNQALALELLVVAGLIAFFAIVRMTLSVEKPNAGQQIAEMIHEFTGGQADQVIGHGYETFQAFVTCIFLFVLLNNLLGLIPGLETPTKSPWVPLGIAVLTFAYYQLNGLRVHGFGYIPLRARHVAHHSSLRQHVRQRPGDPGVLLADSAGCSGGVSGTALLRFAGAGVYFHAAFDDLPVAGGFARSLRFNLQFSRAVRQPRIQGLAQSPRARRPSEQPVRRPALQTSQAREKCGLRDPAGDSFRSGQTVGRQREGASTVSLNHLLAVNFRKQENYAETSICVHGPGGSLSRRSGLCGWRLGGHQPGADRRRHRNGSGCGSLRPW
jgi:hypothetical protein